MGPLLVAFLAAHAPAFADDALRARCLDLLSAYEDPATAADWRALGDGAAAELFAIAQDGALSHTKRGNAIVALGWFPAESHRRYLANLAVSEVEDSLFRRKAVFALGNGWGAGALPELTTALQASDKHLRAAAATALGKVGTPAAADALRARLAVESDAMVRGTLTTTLSAK